jgi:hypothetical protein
MGVPASDNGRLSGVGVTVGGGEVNVLSAAVGGTGLSVGPGGGWDGAPPHEQESKAKKASRIARVFPCAFIFNLQTTPLDGSSYILMANDNTKGVQNGRRTKIE